jgi:FtsP/CotA-like multicopper oxidase with cupredoxin domain
MKTIKITVTWPTIFSKSIALQIKGFCIAILLFLFLSNSAFAQKVVRYDLYVKDTIVNFTGKPKRAIAVNGQIPMPTLTFTEGDIAEIYVHNELDEETSLHWHGLLLPNRYDGVPNLTQMPIKAHTTHL